MSNIRIFIISASIVVLIFIVGVVLSPPEFDSIKIRKNPSIYLPSGDTISNREQGYIDIHNSTIRAKYFIADSVSRPGEFWSVSPNFVLSYVEKTASTIQSAINALDSGVVFVYPGNYSERITAKSKIAIIGSDVNSVHVSRTDDTVVVYGNSVDDFSIENMSFENIKSSDITPERNVFKFVDCWKDSATYPGLQFNNIFIKTKDADKTYGIYLDSSSMYMTRSQVQVSDDECGAIRVDRGSIAFILNCSLENAGFPGAGTFYSETGTTSTIYLGYNTIYSRTLSVIGLSGITIDGYAFHNISDSRLTDMNLLLNSGNFDPSNFFLPVK